MQARQHSSYPFSRNATDLPQLNECRSLLPLYSSSDGSESDHIHVVQFYDSGSQPHYAKVQLKGVLAQGIVYSGADVSIMGAELFKKVAATHKIKKKAFQEPDKSLIHMIRRRSHLMVTQAPAGYFLQREDNTDTSVREDGCSQSDQSLLSESVCKQFGILTHH